MMLRKHSLGLLVLLLCLVVVPLAWGMSPQYVGPIYDGPDLDYQPSIIRVQPGGRLLVIFERIRLSDFFGNFYAVYSDDNGETWSPPQLALGSSLNERHPSLLQLGPDSFALFFLVDETGSGSYRLHRATSTDGGSTWADQGMLDLGWATPGEINPNVIREANGTLTMTYHRLSGPSYIAQSTDDGVTWDTQKTQVSDANAQLPRLAKRESDGLYVVTYQVGSSNLDLFAKVSYDPYDWSGPAIPVSTDLNTHDSQPVVLEDGSFLVTYAKTFAGYFDLAYRVSCDGVTWLSEVQVTSDPAHYDTQPHALPQGTFGHVILTWPHQDGGTPYQDHDLWVNSDLVVPPSARPSLCASRKEVDPPVFQSAIHTPLTYTLVLPNNALPTVAWLFDSVPVSTTYKPGSLWASSGDYGYAAGVITWTGSISSAEWVTITFQVSTTQSLADGDLIVNEARLTDGLGLVYPLVAAATADGEPPASAILDPLDGQRISDTSYLVSGVASDTVAGVALVEVSLDGGPWQPAQGQESWSFQASGLADGSHNLRSRATDGVGRGELPGPGITVTVDATPPSLLAYSPADGAVDVPLSASVVLTFSESILTNSLAYLVEPDPGGWSVQWSPGAAVARLSHAAFDPGQGYTFTLAQARDGFSNPIDPAGWSFTTVPPCRPVEILSVTRAISGCRVTFGAELSGTAPFDYAWDFAALGSSTATAPLVDFGSAGTYPYTLTVHNCVGANVVTHSGEVTVTCAPPCRPVEILSVTRAISGCRVAFGAELSGTAPLEWLWDFGDGVTSTEALPVHDYQETGPYTVTLVVRNCGGLYSDSRSVVVRPTCAPTWAVYLPVLYKNW